MPAPRPLAPLPLRRQPKAPRALAPLAERVLWALVFCGALLAVGHAALRRGGLVESVRDRASYEALRAEVEDLKVKNDALADEAEKLARNFNAVKLRLGYPTLQDDLAALRAVRSPTPTQPIHWPPHRPATLMATASPTRWTSPTPPPAVSLTRIASASL